MIMTLNPNLAPRSFAAVRRGVSLMELMFAIGIIMVGLLGVAMLIPAAGKMAADGEMYDRSAREGLNAVREFELRNMGKPERWVHLANGLDDDADGTIDEADEIPFLLSQRPPRPLPANTGFCLDPRFVAINGLTTGSGLDARLFPYVTPAASDPSSVRMRRISLYKLVGLNGADDDGDSAKDELDELALTPALADEIFMSQDDLRVDQPIDPQLPAQQVYGAVGDKRQYDGKISWMATLAPRVDAGLSTNDLFTLSIVVFHVRDAGMPMDGLTEKVAFIPHRISGGSIQESGFYGGGVSGGDVAITTRQASTMITDLDIKRGQWVMLARNSGSGPLFRWYKVLEADPNLGDSAELAGTSPTAGRPIRHMTLSGPDWTPDDANPTLVYIVPGIVTVYEKTVRLETTSLWNQ